MASPISVRVRPLTLATLCMTIVAAACNTGQSPSPTRGASPDASPAASGAAACPSIPAPDPQPAGWGIPSETPSVIPVLITSPVICGENRVLFSFVDAENRPAAAPDRSASLAIYELGRDSATPIATAEGQFVWAIEDFAGIYVANVDFPSSGLYGAEYVTAAAGGPSETIRMTFDVQPSSPVVKAGDRAPASRTPTLDDVGGDVARISTDDDPDPAFYETSVDEALTDHEPFVLVFATPKFCKTAQCGPTLDRIKPFADRYPTVTFINVEPYELTFQGGSLEAALDATGNLQPVAVANEWGLIHEPIVFVVDRRGVVDAVFELIFSDAELSAALDTVK